MKRNPRYKHGDSSHSKTACIWWGDSEQVRHFLKGFLKKSLLNGSQRYPSFLFTKPRFLRKRFCLDLTKMATVEKATCILKPPKLGSRGPQSFTQTGDKAALIFPLVVELSRKYVMAGDPLTWGIYISHSDSSRGPRHICSTLNLEVEVNKRSGCHLKMAASVFIQTLVPRPLFGAVACTK